MKPGRGRSKKKIQRFYKLHWIHEPEDIINNRSKKEIGSLINSYRSYRKTSKNVFYRYLYCCLIDIL